MSIHDEHATEDEIRLRDFIEGHAAKVAPLEKEMNLAYWDATLSGDDREFDRYSGMETRIKEIYSDPDDFAFLKAIREGGNIATKFLRRQLELLFLSYQGNQVEPALMKRIVSISSEVEKKFNEYRGVIDGDEVTSNDIMEILKTEIDSDRRRKAWEAYKGVGPRVRERVLELVGLRNRAARDLGFSDFYEMSLTLIEQDPREIRTIFDDLAEKTEEPFSQLMEQLKGELSGRYGLVPDELMPWHYEDPFFQEAPAISATDMDGFYREIDLESLVNGFFSDAGIDPADIMARSDLYEKKGKMQHAYCTDIDRLGDIRILANLRPNDYWAGVLLHEMGHAVYNKYIDPELPWILRGSAHSFTTEAIAQLFGRLIRNPTWLHHTLGVPRDRLEPIAEELVSRERLEMLVFARWTMVVTHFERELYARPDQDLNRLWWDLKRHYQKLDPPPGRDEPDWASKIHIAAWPVYYHNYMLGEMMASQLLNHMSREVLGDGESADFDFTGHPELGEYLIRSIFRPGKKMRWDELLVSATGESLNPDYFAMQFL